MSAADLSASPAAAGPPLEWLGVARRAGDREVLADVSLAVPRGSITALLGVRGAGKSLLLRLALGLEPPDRGAVALLGRAPASLHGPERARLLARVGVVFTGGALFTDWSVARNVGFLSAAVQRRPPADVARAVRESLLLVGLKQVEHERADALSPGARQRVALARAIAHRPELLLLDDATGELDPIGTEAFLELVAQLRERLGLTVLAATRDPRAAFRIADRVAMLHGGRIAAEGIPDEIRRHPDAALQQLLAGRAHGPIAP
ncbi:MAG TPA: ATP-binding cassette domain-containing protein [Myxococcota bacterium]|nr:ATP-binding cassette domain-containing protein [Myxococcota bacterium]